MSSDPANETSQKSTRDVPERIAVVVNGNAKNVTRDIVETLDQILSGGDLFVSRRIEESTEIAETIAQRGYGTVLTGGGDGTFTVMLTEVVKACRRLGRRPPRFGLLKLGTGNSLAWVVGASPARGRGLAADILRLRNDAGSRELRMVEADDVLSPFAGFGVDGTVLLHKEATKAWMLKTPILKKLASGELIYFVSTVTKTLPEYALHKIPHCRIINEGSDAVRVGYRGAIVGSPIPKGTVLYEGKARIASCSTIPYYGFGLRIFPYANERDDRMNLRIATAGVVDFLGNMKSIWNGTYYNPRIVTDFLVDDVSIEFDPPTPFQIGGDYHGTRNKVRMRLSPEPIEMVDFYAPPRS